MKKLLFFLFISLFSVSALTAQERVGFSDPEFIQPLLDYRLPAWGYQNLLIDATLNGNLQRRNRDYGSTIDNEFSGEFSPLYTRYRESEERVSTFILNPLLAFERQEWEYSRGQEQLDHTLQFDTSWKLQEQWYREGSDLFLFGQSTGEFSQTTMRDEEFSQNTMTTDVRELRRRFNTTFSVGIGYGRLRNVNPMIRSLRLNERLQSLQTGQALEPADLHQAARHFTRYNGYQQNFDRPQKQFWRDLDPLLSADLSALDPFDLLYLTDVTSEAIGQRSEGWNVEVSSGIRYRVLYDLEEENISGSRESQLTQRTYFVPALSGVWSKNFTLEHQVRLQSSVSMHMPIQNSSLENYVNVHAGGSWLYNLTDRILLNTGANYQWIGSSSFSFIQVNSNINYFIEDRVVLFSTLQYTYVPEREVGPDSHQTQRIFLFQAGLRYYLIRDLF